MLTELDKTTLLAIVAGFLSGSVGSTMSYILQSKSEKQAYTIKKFFNRLFFISLSYSAILGLGVFVSATWNVSTSIAELNKFTITMASCFALMPVIEKFGNLVISRFKVIVTSSKI